MQLQPDRIIHNWRKRTPEHVYPRYETVRRRFESDLGAFTKFLALEELGEFRPNQCEVTYINIIEFPEGTDPHPRLEQITPFWSARPIGSLPEEFENALIQSQFVLKDATDEKPFGRLYVNFQPAVRQTDLTPVVRLEITARARPLEESVASAFDMLDEERSAIVRTFAALTTPEMHKLWGRTDGRQ